MCRQSRLWLVSCWFSFVFGKALLFLVVVYSSSTYYTSIAQHSDAPKPFILMQKMKGRIVTSKDSAKACSVQHPALQIWSIGTSHDPFMIWSFMSQFCLIQGSKSGPDGWLKNQSIECKNQILPVITHNMEPCYKRAVVQVMSR